MGMGRIAKGLKKSKTWKKAFNKSGRLTENAGYGVVAVGMATGQPEVVAGGTALIGVGKGYQGVGQGIKAVRGGRLEEGVDILQKTKSSFDR
jgi:hypothetical protein